MEPNRESRLMRMTADAIGSLVGLVSRLTLSQIIVLVTWNYVMARFFGVKPVSFLEVIIIQLLMAILLWPFLWAIKDSLERSETTRQPPTN